MEPLTQALLGAGVGHAVAGRRLGRRALLWGAALGAAPDLDVVLAPLHDGYGEWLYHRGTTHSLWFGFVAGPALAWLLWRWRDPDRETPLASWVAMAIAALVTHPILDGFTPYGTQLFAPFWRERFAWNGVGIVDPFYTVPLAVGVACVVSPRIAAARGSAILIASLAVTTLYLGAGVLVNRAAERSVEARLTEAGIEIERVRVYPTILQPWARYFVARSDGRILYGWHSSLDPACPRYRIRRDPPPSAAARQVLATWEGRLLRWFAMDEVGVREFVEGEERTIVVDDLRYGWGGRSGVGMWGVVARVDASGEVIGPVRRYRSRADAAREPAQLLAAVAGALPGADSGFRAPGDCV